MVYYIIATRKSGSTESEITHYLYNYDKSSSKGYEISKSQFWVKVASTVDSDTFYCYNSNNNPETLRKCEWQFDKSEPYLKTEPNGTDKDNLMSLPGIAD